MKTFDLSVLAQFTGTENYYPHPPDRSIMMTDGVKYLADCGALWLTDEIVLAQNKLKEIPFQFWKFTLNSKNECSLVCTNGDEKVLYSDVWSLESFTPQGVKFFKKFAEGNGTEIYFTNNVLLLPSEY